MIPGILKDGLDRYSEDHVPTGGFLRACLANDFLLAAARADMENAMQLKEVALYILNHLPRECYGSYEKVEAWIALGIAISTEG